MSSSAHLEDLSGRPKAQEPELLPMRKLVAVAVVAGIVFAAATLWSIQILHREAGMTEPQQSLPIPREIGRAEIGIVEQRLFELQLEAQHKRQEQMKRLSSYGWVDRQKGIIHLPVERAMEQMVSESRP
jgi:hypothetical protein